MSEGTHARSVASGRGLVASRRGVLRGVLGWAAGGSAGVALAQIARPNLDEAARLILERSNEFRTGSGQRTLAPDQALTQAAVEFARYMARTDRYSHEADGRTPAQRAVAAGYDFCVVLENIAYVQSSAGFETIPLATRLMTGWQESPGHRRNLLDPDVTQTGVALVQSAETQRFYAVQMFGRPESMALTFSIANESPSTVRYELGTKVFELGPGVTRTHQQCRAEPLAVQGGKGIAAGDAQPVGGERFVVRGDRSGALRMERR